MYKLGLTGGIATGKSTVSKYLQEEKGLPVIDADLIAYQITADGQPALKEIVRAFGPGMVSFDGQLNRKKLGALVFNDNDAREKLNQITHPRVYAEFERQLAELESQGVPLVVLDIPLLFESNQGMAYDGVALVTIDEKTQLKRLMNRNQLDEPEAWHRIHAQMPLAKKQAMADFLIDNSSTLEHTYAQVDELLEAIKS
ncbi:dephospho-CoA kinase [Weissella minor]|uniref:Dephospho-CoA kinase n=1 Tax=Weissella minor TaxID=1620 RepID=A0A0R2JMI1_9LACO|nr:dephospho-CoA kinase [Weissella minor]KRN77078.1 dephospho-CoA kinase [Weissella minor]